MNITETGNNHYPFYVYENGRRYQHEVKITRDGDRLLLRTGYSKRILPYLRAFEGSSWNPDKKCWTIKKDSARNFFRLGFHTETVGDLENYKRFNVDPVPFNDDRLRENQQTAVSRFLASRRFLIAHDMGLGKTLTALKCAQQLQLTSRPVIICPKNVRDVWTSEIKKWDIRLYPILTTNSYQAIKKLMDWIPEDDIPELLILDESQKFKSKSAKRTQLILQLAQRVPNVILLSGTPQPKDPGDWWTQTEIIQPGFLPYRDPEHMRRELGHLEENDFGYKVVGWKIGEVEKLQKRLKLVYDRRLKSECTDLPEKIFSEIYCEYSEDTQRQCATIIEEATNPYERLRQLSDGFQYPNDSGFDVLAAEATESNRNLDRCIWYNNAKIDALGEFLEGYDRTRIVVYAAYRASIDRLTKEFGKWGWIVIRCDGRGTVITTPDNLSALAKAKIKDASPVELFQEMYPYIPVAWVGHPQSGGIGITLTKSDTLVHYSLTTKGEDYMQSNDRIHRLGMTGTATIYRMIHTPIDQVLIDNAEGKVNLQKLSLGEYLSDYEKQKMENQES